MDEHAGRAAVACSLNDAQLRQRRALVRRTLRPHLLASENLESGLRLTFPDSEPMRATLQQFVDLERQCCSFLTFTIAPPGEGLTLTIEGPPEAGAVLAMFAEAMAERPR